MQNSRRLLLAPFERYMIVDDSPEYPMTCHMRFWFDGELRRDLFESSIQQALLRHPVLTSHVIEDRGKWYFEPVQPRVSEIMDWQVTSKDPDLLPQCLPDLRLRVLVRIHDGKSLVILQFHHAVCDGVGIFQFLEDTLKLYDSYHNGVPCSLPELDPAAIYHRYTFGFRNRGWRRVFYDFKRVARFFAQFATSIGIENEIPLEKNASLRAAVNIALARKTVQALRHTSKAMHVTVNDVLLHRLYYVLAEINQIQTGSVLPLRCLRISVATSMRTPADVAMSAANLVSMVFLSRTLRQLRNEFLLLRGIADEMKQIRDDRMGVAMLRCMALWEYLGPRVMNQILKLPICMATAVLTNLGRPFQESSLLSENGLIHAGNLILTRLDTLPPVRPKTRIAFSVNSYGGILNITMRYDSRIIPSNEAQKFVSIYAASIEEFCSKKNLV